MTPTYLADTSALLELHLPAVGARLVGLLVGGQVATCGLVDLELLARIPATDRSDALHERRQFPRVPCDDAVFDRAAEVQVASGEAIPAARFAVAAAAELAGLVLLHDDPAFERIAAITGQPMERVVPRGSNL